MSKEPLNSVSSHLTYMLPNESEQPLVPPPKKKMVACHSACCPCLSIKTWNKREMILTCNQKSIISLTQKTTRTISISIKKKIRIHRQWRWRVWNGSLSPGEPKMHPLLPHGYFHQHAERDAAVRPISLYACGRKNIRQKWAFSPLFSLHNFPRSGTTSQPSLPHTHLRAQWAVSDLKDGGRKESQLF